MAPAQIPRIGDLIIPVGIDLTLSDYSSRIFIIPVNPTTLYVNFSVVVVVEEETRVDTVEGERNGVAKFGGVVDVSCCDDEVLGSEVLSGGHVGAAG